VRWIALGLLERLIAKDPERTWQLVRRAARDSSDWITVDALARVVGRGVLAEPYRWAELELLVFSPSRWERRLVGSTIATIPFIDRVRGRDRSVADRGLNLVGQLIGDSQPMVQKALAWALRSLARVDRDAVAAWCEREASAAAASDDGHRAWVVRDALAALDPTRAAALRTQLAGIRRRPGAQSTSTASEVAARSGQDRPGQLRPEPARS
jgi:3-methyladenine DNA glycosylase AlkD